ncbi:MAG: DNA-formamidopyrimidine glycosylase [Erysipelotrichaceae bacterium]|nr:DNA-formamidopyrimidine glycosylase [Erysipelotrichaceae bacterium]
MPELPEVETVVRTLELQVKDTCIDKVEVFYPKMIEMEVNTFIETLEGQSFREFKRRGKYLLLGMDTCYLMVHLRMEGKFYLHPEEEIKTKHVHVIFHLRDGRQLWYHDTRKFGRMQLYPLDMDFDQFHDLGYEPFDERLDVNYLYPKFKSHQIPIKSVLLDQRIIAGIGNIYADEILYACKIHPETKANRITKKQCTTLIEQTRRILSEAIKAGGTTLRSYTSSYHITGRFQLMCKVHGQTLCECGNPIKKIVVGQRGTYYCPICQKKRY